MEPRNIGEAMGMSPPVGARLAFVIFFSILQSASFVFEAYRMRQELTWKSWQCQMFAGVIFVVGLALALATFICLGTAQQGINIQCKAIIDGDIAGDGVRSAVWVQQGMLFLSVSTGLFHFQSTAAKEVGAGLLITHTSLGIALLVQMRQKTLSPVDAAIGMMILDAQNMALSIQLSSKETLAARWQVGTVLPAQFIGLAIIGVLMAKFDHGYFGAVNCECFSFFWWAWKSTCSAMSRSEKATFWVYYAFRWVNLLQTWWFSLGYTCDFHRCENDEDEYEVPAWEKRLATVNFSFLANSLFAVVSMAAAEVAIRDYGSYKNAESFSISQITGMVVASTTALRAIWVFGYKFLFKNN